MNLPILRQIGSLFAKCMRKLRFSRRSTSKGRVSPLVRRSVVLFSCSLPLAVGLWGYLWVNGLDVSRLENPLPQPTYLYDRNGQAVSKIAASRIEPVSYSQIPKVMRDAIVAAEDRRFYDHPGIDIHSIARALYRDLRSGSYSEGGSTITQQLAKNLFLPTDKTIGRKLKEAAYALKIDMKYDKDEILELYLNSIYFGDGAWGIQAASKTYFGKDVRDLKPEEAALLAGLPKAPSHYSPVQDPKAALERRNLVLGLMRDQGFLDPAAAQAAIAAPIHLKKQDGESLSKQHLSYVNAVIEEAIDRYGFTETQLLSSGLHIYTAMDTNVQQDAEAVYARKELFPASPDDRESQSGTVILDQKDGGIRAVIGGRGDIAFRGFDHATQLKRQPGSSFKPIMVYGPALEKGYTPSSLLYDGDLNIAGYQPHDWDDRTRGAVTMAEAVSSSWNIPAVWLLNEIGVNTGADFSKKLGIPLGPEDRTLSAALGGLTNGVSPLQMAQAFSAFANDGVLVPAHTIVKITTADGIPLVQASPKPVRVMSAETARTMTQLLIGVVQGGTGKNAAMNRPVAGKSGTTQLPNLAEFKNLGSNSAKDAWFVGYTPELTSAVWVGFDDTDRTHYLTTSGGAAPAVIFREMLTLALKDVPVSGFLPPQLVAPAPTPEPDRPDPKENQDKKDPGPGHGHGKGHKK